MNLIGFFCLLASFSTLAQPVLDDPDFIFTSSRYDDIRLGHAVAPNAYGAPEYADGTGAVFVETLFPTGYLAPISMPLLATGDQFGFDVDRFSDLLVASAPGDNDKGDNAGAVYVLWREQVLQKLVLPNGVAGDQFGYSLDLFFGADGHLRIAVGAPFRDTKTADAGGVYVFRASQAPLNNNIRFSLQTVIEPSGEALAQFGHDVSGYQARLAVGAPFSNAAVLNAGSVLLYKEVGMAWQLQQQITASDANLGDEFGWAVQLDQNQFNDDWTLGIGAPGDDDEENRAGAVYVFGGDAVSLNEESWLQADKFTQETEADAGHRYGFSLYADNSDGLNNLVVGAPGHDNGRGRVEIIVCVLNQDIECGIQSGRGILVDSQSGFDTGSTGYSVHGFDPMFVGSPTADPETVPLFNLGNGQPQSPAANSRYKRIGAIAKFNDANSMLHTLDSQLLPESFALNNPGSNSEYGIDDFPRTAFSDVAINSAATLVSLEESLSFTNSTHAIYAHLPNGRQRVALGDVDLADEHIIRAFTDENSRAQLRIYEARDNSLFLEEEFTLAINYREIKVVGISGSSIALELSPSIVASGARDVLIYEYIDGFGDIGLRLQKLLPNVANVVGFDEQRLITQERPENATDSRCLDATIESCRFTMNTYVRDQGGTEQWGFTDSITLQSVEGQVYFGNPAVFLDESTLIIIGATCESEYQGSFQVCLIDNFDRASVYTRNNNDTQWQLRTSVAPEGDAGAGGRTPGFANYREGLSISEPQIQDNGGGDFTETHYVRARNQGGENNFGQWLSLPRLSRYLNSSPRRSLTAGGDVFGFAFADNALLWGNELYFLDRSSIDTSGDDFCFPIVTKQGKVAVVCL